MMISAYQTEFYQNKKCIGTFYLVAPDSLEAEKQAEKMCSPGVTYKIVGKENK